MTSCLPHVGHCVWLMARLSTQRRETFRGFRPRPVPASSPLVSPGWGLSIDGKRAFDYADRMGSEINWCFAHECQVIRAWKHPILSRHRRFVRRAWCEVADFLEANGIEPGECSIGTVSITKGT